MACCTVARDVGAEEAEGVDMSVEQLSQCLFLTHVGQQVRLELDAGSSGKTLFCFCLELLARGLVLLYGDGGGSVSLQRVALADFARVAGMLRSAGIVAALDPCPGGGESPAYPMVDTSEARAAPEHLALGEYCAHVLMNDDVSEIGGRYALRFALER